jgi:hypothetical protein
MSTCGTKGGDSIPNNNGGTIKAGDVYIAQRDKGSEIIGSDSVSGGGGTGGVEANSFVNTGGNIQKHVHKSEE